MIIANPQSPAAKILEYVTMAYRQRRPIILCVVLGGIVGAAAAYALPKQYESFSTFIVEGQTIPDPFEGGRSADALERAVKERIQNMQHILLSRSFLEKVIDKSGLRYRADTPDEKESLLAEVKGSISISRIGGNVVSIVYRGDSPDEAAEVANIILAQYEETINAMFGDKLKGIIYFLEEEREAYRQRLAEAAQELSKFKMEHIQLLPGSEGGHLQRLSSLENQRMEVELSILGKQRELEFVTEQLDRFEPYIREQTMVNQGPEVAAQMRLVESLEARLQELLLKRTEKSTEVIGLRERLAEARQKLEELKEENTAEVSEELLVRNPVLIEQENARATLELEIMGLQARKASLDAQIDELTAQVVTIPDQERILQDKMTEYDVEREKYLLLLREEHSRKLSKSMADHGQGAKFILLDRPVKQRKAVFPIVPLFVAVGLGLGLFLGGLIGFLREWLNQTVRSAEEVRAMLALPVLATVPSLAFMGEEAARVLDEERKGHPD